MERPTRPEGWLATERQMHAVQEAIALCAHWEATVERQYGTAAQLTMTPSIALQMPLTECQAGTLVLKLTDLKRASACAMISIKNRMLLAKGSREDLERLNEVQ